MWVKKSVCLCACTRLHTAVSNHHKRLTYAHLRCQRSAVKGSLGRLCACYLVVESVVERVGQRLGYVMLISLVGVGRHQSHCERGERGKVVHGINLKGFFIVTSALSSLFAPPTEIVAQSRNVPLIDVGKL